MGENFDHTLVNPNQMRHHIIDVQDNHCMQNPMVITCHAEEVAVKLYKSGTIVFADT